MGGGALHYVNYFGMNASLYISVFYLFINSLAFGGFEYSLKLVKIDQINLFSIFCEIGTRWMPQTDHYLTLVQVMAWYRQARAFTWANADLDPIWHH